jgi:hypothetical protein
MRKSTISMFGRIGRPKLKCLKFNNTDRLSAFLKAGYTIGKGGCIKSSFMSLKLAWILLTVRYHYLFALLALAEIISRKPNGLRLFGLFNGEFLPQKMTAYKACRRIFTNSSAIS